MRERSAELGAALRRRRVVVRAIILVVLSASSGGLLRAEGAAIPVGAAEPAPDPRAEAARLFPDAPAVALEDATTWSADGIYKTRRRLSRSRRVLVQSPRGLDQANGMLPIPNDYALVDFKAESECPGRRSQPVPEHLRQTVVLYRRGESEIRALKWTYPDTRPGCIVSWGVTLEYKEDRGFWYPGDNRSGWWELDSAVPTIQVEFTVVGKAEVSPTVSILGRDAGKCALKSQLVGTVASFTCANVPKYESEPHSGPVDVDRLRAFAVLFPDGASGLEGAIARSLAMRLATSVATRGSLTALLPTVLADAQTSESKIRAIVRWVRSHVSVTTVEGEARGVDTVLKSGSGDAEERAIVLATMITAAGIPSSVVWANDRSFADLPKFFPDPSLGERMLVRVDANQGVFIDLECDTCPAGVVHWRSSGHGSGGIALPVNFCTRDPGGGPVTNCRGLQDRLDIIPGRAAEHNVERHRQRIHLDVNGDAQVEGTREWYMQEAVAWRERLEGCDDDALREIVQEQIGAEFENVDVEVENLDDVEKLLTIRYGYRVRRAALRFESALLLRPPDVYSSRIGLPITEERLGSVRWEYVGSVLGRSTFVIPPGYRVTGTLPKLRIDGPGMKFSAEWRPGESAAEVVFDGGLMLERPVVPAADYPAARRFVAAVQEFLRGGIVLERGP